MRPIRKGPEPPELREWKAKTSDDWQPTYSNLSNLAKDAIRRDLLKEQGAVCCYCEQRIEAQSGTSHIEHLEPQTSEEGRGQGLDYTNMLYSCSATRSQHCGHKKQETRLGVHPLMEDCTSHFEFGSDGGVAANRSAKNKEAGIGAIKTLGLNAEPLRLLRREALDSLLRYLDAEQLDRIPTDLMQRDEEGKNLPFATFLVQVLAR